VNRSKRIRNGRRLKAASPLVPGPGSRALPAEIMRRLLGPGRVGPTGLGFPRRFPLRVGVAGGRPIGPPHPAEADRSLPEKGSPGRWNKRISGRPPIFVQATPRLYDPATKRRCDSPPTIFFFFEGERNIIISLRIGLEDRSPRTWMTAR